MKPWKAKGVWEMGFHIKRKSTHETLSTHQLHGGLPSKVHKRSLSGLSVHRAIVTIFPKRLEIIFANIVAGSLEYVTV